jgi:hypothetical protein
VESGAAYFVLLPLPDGLVDPDGLEVEPLDPGVDGLVEGDAEGERSPGFSPVFVPPPSVHAAANVVTRASRQKPLTSFFILNLLLLNRSARRIAAIEVPLTRGRRPSVQQHVCQRACLHDGRWCTLAARQQPTSTEDPSE